MKNKNEIYTKSRIFYLKIMRFKIIFIMKLIIILMLKAVKLSVESLIINSGHKHVGKSYKCCNCN